MKRESPRKQINQNSETKDVLIKTQNKNKCRKKSETETETEKDRRHRETETRTRTGVLGVDRSIKGRESGQYLEMHEDEGEAATAAAAVRKSKRSRAAQMRWRGIKGIQRWPCYIWGETERRGVRGFRQHGKGPPVQPVTGKEGRPGGEEK